MGQTEDVDYTPERNYTKHVPQQISPKPFFKREKSNLNELEQIQSSLEPKLDKQWPTVQMNDERRIAIPNFVSGDLRELDEKVKSMMETSQNLRPDGASKAKICKVCGKEGAGIAIRDHIEAKHLEGVSLPCNICGKEFRSRQRLRQHTCNRK